MSAFRYPASVKIDSAGSYLVTFPDVTEEGTDAETREEALEGAVDSLIVALREGEVSNVELGRRLGISERAVRRLLDLETIVLISERCRQSFKALAAAFRSKSRKRPILIHWVSSSSDTGLEENRSDPRSACFAARRRWAVSAGLAIPPQK